MKNKPTIEAGPVEWEVVLLPVPPDYESVTVKVIRGTGPSDVWVLASARRRDSPGAPLALSFHFNRRAWTSAEVPARATTSLVAIDPSDAWAVGRYGTVAHWDGRAWTASKIDGIDYDLLDVAGWHDDIWVAAAGPDLLHYDGARWIKVSPPELAGTSVHMLFALPGAATPGGELLVPRNLASQTPGLARLAGGVWRVQEVGPGGVVHVAASGPSDIWAIGAFNQGYHFDGFAWSKFPTASTRVLGVYATSPTEAYLVGENGLIMAWNGGAWSASSSGTHGRLWTVYAPAGGEPLAGGEAGLLRRR